MGAWLEKSTGPMRTASRLGEVLVVEGEVFGESGGDDDLWIMPFVPREGPVSHLAIMVRSLAQ